MNHADEGDDPPFEFDDVWPDEKAFPLSDAECACLVRGHPVRWRSTLDERHRQLDDLGRGELRSRPSLEAAPAVSPAEPNEGDEPDPAVTGHRHAADRLRA